MKKDFFDLLNKYMEENRDIYILFGGLGYPRVEEFLEKYPDRAINCEASEQTMLDIAVGLAYEKKIPFCYTITPFLYRGFETIRTYINHENLPVVLIGAGRDEDYSKDDGYSHDAKDIERILNTQDNIAQCYPNDKNELDTFMNIAINTKDPHFISLRR